MSMKYVMPEKKDRKIALVVVDVQRKFTGGTIPEESNKEIINTINKATSLFRENDRPVIFIRYDGPSDCCEYKKNDGNEYLHGIVSDKSDITVHKEHMNSFTDTSLSLAVKICGCDSILIAGMVTQYCVLATYYGAFEHSISPYLLEGGLIATADQFNDAAFVLCKTFTMEDVVENLQTTKIVHSSVCGMDYPCLPHPPE